MSITWHADPQLLSRYVSGELNDVGASSLEAHLLSCEHCREQVAPLVPDASLTHMWQEIAEIVDEPRVGPVERALMAIGIRDHVARLIAATPSLRLSWFLAEVVVLGFAAIASNFAPTARSSDSAMFLFLALAALAPVAGVAASFGPRIDPTYEIGLAAPLRSDWLLLLRALAVLATSTVIAGITSLIVPGLDHAVAVWLLPALGLTLATLAVATWLRPIAAACSVGLAWLAITVTVSVARADSLAAFRAGGQMLSLGLIAVSALVLWRRHTYYEGEIAT